MWSHNADRGRRAVSMSKYDVDFLQSMVEHHRQAVSMATAYLAHPDGQRMPVVSRLAEGVITAQTGEIKQMVGWLEAAGKPTAGAKMD